MTEEKLARINSIVKAYDELIVLLDEAKDARLIAFTDSIRRSTKQLKLMLAQGDISTKAGGEVLKGLRQGLKETPRLLQEIAPELSGELIQRLESTIGCKLAGL